ncbi:MAG: DNA cytosine methyltransferase, partial [Gemmataceae bacterium]
MSLFTGAGGLDIGLESAGFRTVAAVESDPDCVETLRANQAARVPCARGRPHLDGTALLAGRIESLDPAGLKPLGARPDWVPDLLAGGPPCQPFSSSGAMRSVADPRGRLFEQFVRVAGALRPRFLLFENVRGLITARGPGGEPGEVLLMVKEAFEGLVRRQLMDLGFSRLLRTTSGTARRRTCHAEEAHRPPGRGRTSRLGR